MSSRLTPAERKIIRKLAAELDGDEGDEYEDDEAEAEAEAPRQRRAPGRHRSARVADRVSSDGDVFVLRGPSADRFLASLGLGGADGQAEADEGDEAEGEPQSGRTAEEAEPPARQDPEPVGRTHRYFR